MADDKVQMLQCPKCSGTMGKVLFHDVEVDQCARCDGLWLDAPDYKALKRRPGSEVLDTGDPETGKMFRDVKQVDCPVCQAPMNLDRVPDQPHIWYETCDTCGGVFFDAGEFRDFKDHTLADFVKDFFSAERD